MSNENEYHSQFLDSISLNMSEMYDKKSKSNNIKELNTSTNGIFSYVTGIDTYSTEIINKTSSSGN